MSFYFLFLKERSAWSWHFPLHCELSAGDEWEVFQWKFVLLRECRDEKTSEVQSRNSDMKIYSPDIEEKLPVHIIPGSSWSRRVPSWKTLVKIKRNGNENAQSRVWECSDPSLWERRKSCLYWTKQGRHKCFLTSIQLFQELFVLSLNIVWELPTLEDLF